MFVCFLLRKSNAIDHIKQSMYSIWKRVCYSFDRKYRWKFTLYMHQTKLISELEREWVCVCECAGERKIKKNMSSCSLCTRYMMCMTCPSDIQFSIWHERTIQLKIEFENISTVKRNHTQNEFPVFDMP